MQINIDAVILAAGKSERFGQPKVLHSFLGEPFVSRIIKGFRQAGVRNITLVLGHNAGEYIREIPQSGFPYIVINRDYELGQFSSLQAGIRSINKDADGILMTLIDCPHILDTTYDTVVKKAIEFPENIVIPSFNSRGGHPVYLPKWFFSKIMEAPPSGNLRHLFDNHTASIQRCEVSDKGITMDIDTFDDLKQLEKLFAARHNVDSYG